MSSSSITSPTITTTTSSSSSSTTKPHKISPFSSNHTHNNQVIIKPFLTTITKNEKYSYFSSIPDPILISILSYLDVKNALSIRRVCKRFRLASVEGLSRISYYSIAARAVGHTLYPPGPLAVTAQFWAVEARWRSVILPGPVVSTICGHKGSVTCLAYKNDDVLVSGSDDSSILVWNVEDPFKKVDDDPLSTVLSSGRIEETSATTTMCRLHQQHHKQSNIRNVTRKLALNGHGGPVWAVTVLDRGSMEDSLVLSGSFDKTIKVWSLTNGNCIQTIRGHTGWVTGLCLSPQMEDDVVISGSSDGTLRLFSISRGTQLARFDNGNDQDIVNSLDWCKHTHVVASGGHRSAVYLHDLQVGKLATSIILAHTQKIYATHFVENESSSILITGGCDMLAKVWDVRSSITCPVLSLQGHSAPVTGVSSVGLYRIATCSTDRCVKVWDARMGHDDGGTHEEAGRWLGSNNNNNNNNNNSPTSPSKSSYPTSSLNSKHSSNQLLKPGHIGCVNTLYGHSGAVFSVVCHSDKVTSGGADQSIKVFRFNNGQ
jgi:WD40 repeat protein